MKLLGILASLAALATLVAAEVTTLAPKEAAKLVAQNKAVLVDVREPDEWAATGVAAPAVLLPKSDFDGEQKQWKEFLARNGDKQVLVYCRSGRRSGVVAEALQKQGVNAANVGGFQQWADAGLPTRKFKPAKKKSSGK